MGEILIGVDGKAKDIERIFIGIDGKATQIKKAYIGDENGIARLFYDICNYYCQVYNNGEGGGSNNCSGCNCNSDTPSCDQVDPEPPCDHCPADLCMAIVNK